MRHKKFFTQIGGCGIFNNKVGVVDFSRNVCLLPRLDSKDVDLRQLKYMGYQNTRGREIKSFDEAKEKTIGFFLHDERFEPICRQPWKYVERLKQYKQVCTPDISCYTDMTLDEQWEGVLLNRLIGAYWKYEGLIVIPTVSWGEEESFEFCFEGIKKGTIVAVSTIGTKKCKDKFLKGFKELCERIEPEKVLCYCRPYFEMRKHAEIIGVEYEGVVANRIKAKREKEYEVSLFPELEVS